MGVAYCWLRCFPEAVECLQQAVGPAAQWPHLLAKVLHNLGAALNSVGGFTPAVSVHRQAASLYGQTSPVTPASPVSQLSHLSVTQCVRVCAGSLGCRGDQARCFSNLAFACSQLGDEEEAAESFILALQGFRDTGEISDVTPLGDVRPHLPLPVCPQTPPPGPG